MTVDKDVRIWNWSGFLDDIIVKAHDHVPGKETQLKFVDDFTIIQKNSNRRTNILARFLIFDSARVVGS